MMVILIQGARYDKSKLQEVANGKFFDVPCDSKQSFACSVTLGDTDLAITQSKVHRFVEYKKNASNSMGSDMTISFDDYSKYKNESLYFVQVKTHKALTFYELLDCNRQ